MVLSSNRNKRGNLTLDELFKRPPLQKRTNSEDEDLKLAIEMSQREHINEQKRLFEQFSLLSQKQFKSSAATSSTATKKRRLIKVEPEEEEEEEEKEERIESFTDDDDDQWFQTVSIRAQQPPAKNAQPKPKLKQKETPKRKSKSNIPLPKSTTSTASTSINNNTSNTIVKREDVNEVILDIDDLDEWLEAKTEKPEASEALEITDLDAYLDNYQDEDDEEPNSVIMIDDQEQDTPQESGYIPCPMCQKLFKQGRDIQEHASRCNNMISDTDTDSDCDIIDLINPANTVISKQTPLLPEAAQAQAAAGQEDDDDDDGYLSPLEGFTSIKNDQNEALNPYFQQLQQPTPKPRKTRTTRKSTTTKRGGRGRFRPYRRKKKS
ncbi:hypothetical protein PS15m_009129 [Mucor circinelloides]